MFDGISDAFSNALGKLTGSGELTEANIEEALREIQRAFLEADVSYQVTKEFLVGVREKLVGLSKTPGLQPLQQVAVVVHEELTKLMGPVDTRISENPLGPTIIMMVGLQGSGKTTTCGKLARYLRERRQKSPLLVAADLQRPAAVEQLKVLGRSLDIPVYAEEAKDGGFLGIGSVTPPKVCANAIKHAADNGNDVVILDTAGRLQIDDELMKELDEIKKKTRPQNIFFVCDAMTGQNAVKAAEGFNTRLDVDGVILTKLDGDARGGAALSVKAVTGKTVKFVGTGETLKDIDEFHPSGMAERILGMGDIGALARIAEQHIDKEDAETSAQRLMEGRWNFEDFLKQIETIQKMGPLKQLMSMMPGVSQMTKGLDVGDDDLKPIKAIISSMTKQERRNPDLLNGSRRRRIAKGSGTSIPQVNNLIKQFKMMKKLTANMAQVGGLGSLFSGGGVQKLLSGMPGGAAAMGGMRGGGGLGGTPNRSTKRRKLSKKDKKKNRKKRKR